MKKTRYPIKTLAKLCLIAGCLGLAAASHATQLINLPFNEGQGMKTADTASGLTGILGFSHDPLVDYVELTTTSPSGQVGDGSITTHGSGFLVVDDPTTSILGITNGPITLEAWVFLPPIGTNTPGIVAYGSSYKMGLRGGAHVFTLFGLKDITNNAVPFILDGTWVHLAAAWEPGVGVHFYVNGQPSFTEYTNSAVARTPLNNLLSIGAEGLGNNWVGSLDRVRIHHALLDETTIDSDAANPKPPIPGSTLVSYNFNEAAFPSTNAILPVFPTAQAHTLYPTNSHLWTNDSPTGLAGDYALKFPANQVTKEQVAVAYGGVPINLGANNTNYTLQAWVKVPTTPFEDRRVIYVTGAPANSAVAPPPRVGLSIHADRTLHTTIFGTADFTSNVQVPNDNRWHQIAVVMENFSQLHFYLDGILRQTVTRTQTGPPNNGGAAALTIGGESNYRYFQGVLDRVVINNDALNASSLDYPAIPGLATFPTLASHPADLSVASGGTAVFTAAPNSSTAATYQWFYRTNLADLGVAVPGKTTTTLTLNNISESDLGFYSLKVSNAVGVSESYAAKLNFPLDPSPARPLDFETPDYTAMTLTGQDGWTSTDNGIRTAFIATADEITSYLAARAQPIGEPTKSGSQALIFTGAGQGAGQANVFRNFSGLENESKVTLDFSVRPLGAFPQNNAIAALANVFMRVQNAAGVNAAGVRIGPDFSIDYGTSAANPQPWQASGVVADPNNWVRITMNLDYTARTYDFFVDGVKINTDPIPFYTATADKFERINIFKGANQAGWILDDLAVIPPADAPTLGIRSEGGNLVLFWPSSVTDYILEGSDSLTSPNWGTVTHSVNGNENQATVQPIGTKFYRLKK